MLRETQHTVGDHPALPLHSMVIITPPHILQSHGTLKFLGKLKLRSQHSRRPWLCRHVKPWWRIKETNHSRPGISLIAGDVALILEVLLLSKEVFIKISLSVLALQVGRIEEERNGALGETINGPDLPFQVIALPAHQRLRPAWKASRLPSLPTS